LLFIGGALGALFGILDMFVNQKIFRLSTSVSGKILASICVFTVSLLLYLILATIF
jgi:hypothetical protein